MRRPAKIAMNSTESLPALSASESTFSAELSAMSSRYHEQPVPLGELLDSFGSRGSALLVVICALPFSTPVSIPGLSTPFGLVILFLATRYFFGLSPWLPGPLRRVVLPGTFFAKVLKASSRLVGWLERRLRARVHALSNADWKRRLHTGVVILSGLLLILPLPPFPPFTNTLPALVSVVMTFSVLKRDGIGILAGYGLFVFTVGYFVFWGAVVVETFSRYGGKVVEFISRLW